MSEPIPRRSDLTKAKRQVFQKHLAHEAVMLAEVQRTKRRAEAIERFAATGDTKDLEVKDDVSVALGNEYHWHHQGEETCGGRCKCFLLLLAILLLSAIIALAAFLWKPSTPSPEFIDTDTNTQYYFGNAR